MERKAHGNPYESRESKRKQEKARAGNSKQEKVRESRRQQEKARESKRKQKKPLKMELRSLPNLSKSSENRLKIASRSLPERFEV